jgi:choline dehydrogenase-like flavoprotein
MNKIVIVGSGASGVHFALSVLKKGYDVTMLDVGYAKPEMVNPDDKFNELKTNLNDPVNYFLGKDFGSVILPDYGSEIYGFPPSKNYVFRQPSNFDFHSKGFEPLFSFAQGGLAEAWTGGLFPYNEQDLNDFPFGYKDIEPHYNEVADRIGVVGMKDDIAQFMPFHDNMMSPLEMDEHTKLLFKAYMKKKDYLNNKLNFYLGYTRVTTLSQDKDERKACNSSGRCLWGCPKRALYIPSITLDQCKQHSNFKYVPNMYVTHYEYNTKQQINNVVAEHIDTREAHTFSGDKFVLAAGALCSSKIFMESIYRKTGEIIKLNGLMDNRQIMMPFVNLNMLGKPYNPESFQFHQILFGIPADDPREYLHGPITTLKTALIHPVVQKFPLDLKTALFMFRNMHSSLGVLNMNFHDTRREDNFITLEVDKKSSRSDLKIEYTPVQGEANRIKQSIKKATKALQKLGCIAPPPMIHIRPMGASVHYAGTIPMRTKKTEFSVSENCQSYDFDNLYIVDGTTYPFLPSKNLTFTLMANAVRVAESVF